MPTRFLATAFALLCFAAAMLAGVVAGNAAGTVLGRGLVVLCVAYAVGRLLEAVATRALAASAAAPDTHDPASNGDVLAEEEAGPRTLPLHAASAGPDPVLEPMGEGEARRAA